MNKSELISWLQKEQQEWKAFLEEIGEARMEQPGVNGDWSMKDVIAHLTGWNHWVLARLQAAVRGEPEPQPPWPAHLQGDDDINAWIYNAYRERSVRDVLDETDKIFDQILNAVKELPDDARIEQVQRGERTYYLVWIGDQRFQPGESFDHFRDDHEPDIRAWLERVKNQ